VFGDLFLWRATPQDKKDQEEANDLFKSHTPPLSDFDYAKKKAGKNPAFFS